MLGDHLFFEQVAVERLWLPAFFALDQLPAQIARDAGADSLESWCRQRPDLEPPEAVCQQVLQLMGRDAKTTGLKQLQGVIWRSGFESGELRSQIFEDVPPALEQWSAAGIDIRIYSSGSVAAQQLFFGHTTYGDLTPCLRGHYDTSTGPKQDPASYTAIAQDMLLAPHQILFLSDVGDELDAARRAGMDTALVLRPGNHPQGATDHPTMTSFSNVSLRFETPPATDRHPDPLYATDKQSGGRGAAAGSSKKHH